MPTPTMPRTLRSRRARLYESVRTAHLERAHELAPAAIVYRVRRYDFDEALADGLEIVQASPIRAALLLRRSRLQTLEINEPLMTSSVAASALAVFAVTFARRRRPSIVTYAIGNSDPFTAPSPSWKRRLRWRIERVLARYVWNRTDAVAYGTQGARDVYEALLPARPRMRATLIPALPVAAERTEPVDRRMRVVFLGAFAPRKGVPLLMNAWPLVVARRSEATLTMMGKGALTADVERFAAEQESVRVLLDPPRSRIREVLAASLVLVLPSQPWPTWREQVGLPIVEGLEQGCAIVTTTETGLAPWLTEHGHGVVAGDADAETLAESIIGQLDAGDRSAEIMKSLPPRDGRLEADSWLFGDEQRSVRKGTGTRD